MTEVVQSIWLAVPGLKGMTSERGLQKVECGLELRNARELEPQLLFGIRQTLFDSAG